MEPKKFINQWIQDLNTPGNKLIEAINGLIDGGPKTKPISPKRIRKAEIQLLNEIIYFCLDMVCLKNNIKKDHFGLSRNQSRKFLEEIPQQLQNIQQLKAFLKKYPFESSIAFESTLFEEQGKELIKMFEDKLPKANAGNFLNSVLSAWENGLRIYPEGVKDESLPMWKTRGRLVYPDTLHRSQETKNPETDNLIFCLAFLFRNYSNKDHPDENWYVDRYGPMPQYGQPNSEHITNIVNAALSKNFSLEDVKKLLQKLVTKNKVFLASPQTPPNSE